ncbi:hypothetical protein ECG_04997 [Echinococcus granulosus]|uniref:EF HAND 1 calcium binding site n=1 Tax=Echinococcus granulosus TaxID=6210 RepID=A0A068X0L4_ECHGR|nr:hypothetical protein ECG_04997 [Echinococcus granulosus]CDS24293.1 EF HAND 1 calcium binding site [Echinococcus granulosus]
MRSRVREWVRACELSLSLRLFLLLIIVFSPADNPTWRAFNDLYLPGKATINVIRAVGGVFKLQPLTPMLLAEEETGRRETVHILADNKEEAHLLSPLLSTAQHLCTSSHEGLDFNEVLAYLHIFTALLRPFRIIACPSDKTISKTERIKNDGSAQENRNFPPLTLVHLVILVLLLSLLPTANAFGLGQTRQQRNQALHRPASAPLFDPERTVDGVPVEDSTVRIRTREVGNHPSTPLQQVENPAADPWLYGVPPVDPSVQRPAYTPVFVPNYNYYTVYGTPWVYPETRLVGTYSPSPAVPQWPPQAYYPRNSVQHRRKTGDRRRKDKYKGEKCPKICETCLRSYDGTDVEVDKERALLQQRFALHVKPSMKHKESVEALFKYMDGNNDGTISFTELQNYLLLHNIISPDVPQ